MADPDHQDLQHLILDFRNNSIVADTISPQFSEALSFEGRADGARVA
jgi:hypothetical protein